MDREFYADQEKININDYLIFTYYFDSIGNPEEAAIHLCQEQSTAQWKRVGVVEDTRPIHGAKILDLKAVGDNAMLKDGLDIEESLQGKKGWIVKLAHPHINFGARLPNLLTAACGEGAFHSPNMRRIKLLDIEFPDCYLEGFEGPYFGLEGIRNILDVHDRPILMGVVKPNIGLSPVDFGNLGYQAWLGGIDIVKDDELLCNTSWCPFKDRAKIMGKLRLDAEEITGNKKIYLANITDEIDQMLELYKIAYKNNVNSIMINGMTTGLAAVRYISKIGKIPIFSHFDFLAPITQLRTFGVHLQVMVKLHRLAGYDCVIYQGFGSRMRTTSDDVDKAFKACLEPMGHIKPVLPVPAGSQWAGTSGTLARRFSSIDFGVVPGRAIFGHPNGPKAGARAMCQAWDAYKTGISFENYAQNHIELKVAIKKHRN